MRCRPSGNATITRSRPVNALSEINRSGCPKSACCGSMTVTSEITRSKTGVSCRVRRCQNDNRAARSPHSSLRHRGNWQRQLALQKPLRGSPRKPRSPRLRHPDPLRRGERYRPSRFKRVKIGRRSWVNFASRLTVCRNIQADFGNGSVSAWVAPPLKRI